MRLPFYVPVIRTLQGEMAGARHASTDTQDRTCPLFEIVEPRPTAENSSEHYLGKAAELIATTWRLRGLAYVELYDAPSLDSDLFVTAHPLVLVHAYLRSKRVHTIPVIATDRESDYRDAIIEVAKRSPTGLAVRLYESNLEVPDETTKYVHALANEAEVSSSTIDLIIDLKKLLVDGLPHYRSRILNFLAALDSLLQYRSATIIGSSLSREVDGISPNNMGELPRLELRLWRDLLAARNGKEPLGFGDYGIVSPEYVDRNGPFPHINAKIPYTTEDSTLIVRGQSRQKEKLEDQYARLARRLAESEFLLESEFSWGDNQIHSCSKQLAAPGHPTKWIAYATSHHLELVSAQVARELALRV